MRPFLMEKMLKIFTRHESGVTLVETLVALAILGTVAVTFLSGLAATSKAVMVSQEKVIAEGLAKSQLEYIKAQSYIPTAEYDPANPEKRYELINISSDLTEGGYAIDINPPEVIISSDGDSFELQSITVILRHNTEEVLTISDYRAGRPSG